MTEGKIKQTVRLSLTDSSLRDIQSRVDELIKTYGSKRVNYLLNALTKITRVGHVDMIKTYIVFIVSNHYDLSIEETISGTKHNHVEAKKVCMWILYNHENLSISDIGVMFNKLSKGRTHSHIATVQSWVDNNTYGEISNKILAIVMQLNKFKAYVENTLLYETTLNG